ncbi:peptidoglycan-binding protein LysM [Christiangramia fulva]|uniref:Peptidoglycan-binding protein LysM n=1 Tax=Christiangramia fulva TaxID=2126553 RepID=A0A2R3Z1T6_9FLAO|nr:DUF1259 domain-containing protein [Christiangramia fulva]AVR44202.1 peptidoglycan-binding protein LysM [Christiangramia fulva]
MKRILVVSFLVLLFNSCDDHSVEKRSEQKISKEENFESPTSSSKRISDFPVDSLNSFWKKELNDKDGFYKITFPRTDIKLKLDDIPVVPALAYTSWIAYLPVENGSRIMGDMVLLDSEISKVLPYLKKNGINITAVHNHLLREKPRLIYMHFAGTGNAIELSKKMKSAFELTATPLTKKEDKDEEVKKVSKNFNWSSVKSILGEGTENKDVIKFTFPRKETIKMEHLTLPKTYGIATSIGFQGLDEQTAAITGDFVMKENEVNDVIATLSKNNIEITALHNHMLHEEPRLFYMHFWAVGEPEQLAKGLREALEKMKVVLN